MIRCTLKFEEHCFGPSLTSSNRLVEPKYTEHNGRDQNVLGLARIHLINPESMAVRPNQVQTGIQGSQWPRAGTYLHQLPNGQEGSGRRGQRRCSVPRYHGHLGGDQAEGQ